MFSDEFWGFLPLPKKQGSNIWGESIIGMNVSKTYVVNIPCGLSSEEENVLNESLKSSGQLWRS